MNVVVSFTDFRNNLSDYFDLIKDGKKEVVVRDEKKGRVIGKLIVAKEKEFDWDEHMEFLKNFKPVFTEKDVEDIKRLRKADRKRLKNLNW